MLTASITIWNRIGGRKFSLEFFYEKFSLKFLPPIDFCIVRHRTVICRLRNWLVQKTMIGCRMKNTVYLLYCRFHCCRSFSLWALFVCSALRSRWNETRCVCNRYLVSTERFTYSSLTIFSKPPRIDIRTLYLCKFVCIRITYT